MKPDYKNWMPKGMILSFLAGAVAALALCLVVASTGLLEAGTLKTALAVIFAVLAVVFCGLTIWSVMGYLPKIKFRNPHRRRWSKYSLFPSALSRLAATETPVPGSARQTDPS